MHGATRRIIKTVEFNQERVVIHDNMANQDDYLHHAINVIKDMRSHGLDNIDKTDLYSNETLYELDNWYNLIIKYLIDNPPDYYIKVIDVVENKHGDFLYLLYTLYTNIHFSKDDTIKTELRIRIISDQSH